MVNGRWTRLEGLVTSIITNPDSESLKDLNDNQDLLDEPITLDCSTLTNHCICTVNFEYVNKPEHMLKCLRKRKCFHCQRYHCMRRAHEVITASTRCILLAAAFGKFQTFKFLHQRGCSLESKTGVHELRPLHLSIIHGHFNIFCYLLSHQVDINAIMKSNGTSYSPLMQAVVYNRKDMIRHLLMVKGLDLSYRNSLSQSPILFAIQNDNLDLMDLILGAEEAYLNRRHGRTSSRFHKLQHPCAVLEAVKQDNAGVLKTLLDNGCNAEYIFNGYHSFTSAAILAAIKNSHRCLKLLASNGADVTTRVDGFSASDWARLLGWTKCVSLLDETNDISDTGITDDGVIDTHGSDTNSPGNRACGRLEWHNEGNIDEHKTMQNGNGNSHSNDLAKAISSPIISVWKLAQWINVDDEIKRLAILGHEVNVQDRYGRTSLHIAVEEQHVLGVRALLQLGANTDVRDMCDATPFWHAVFWNKESMIKELIAANAKLECMANENAYKLGLHSSENYQITIAQENAVLKTPLRIAVEKNFHETTALLIEAGYDTSQENLDALIEVARDESKEILTQHLNEPKTLFAVTRNCIRRCYGVKIPSIANQYDLPTRIRDCLLFKDVLECAYSQR